MIQVPTYTAEQLTSWIKDTFSVDYKQKKDENGKWVDDKTQPRYSYLNYHADNMFQIYYQRKSLLDLVKDDLEDFEFTVNKKLEDGTIVEEKHHYQFAEFGNGTICLFNEFRKRDRMVIRYFEGFDKFFAKEWTKLNQEDIQDRVDYPSNTKKNKDFSEVNRSAVEEMVVS